VFTQKHAVAIAKKLGCQMREGGAHTHADFYVDGKLIVSFGIRRASKEKSHGHIPRDLYLTQKASKDLHDCTFSKEDYLEVLKEKKLLAGSGPKHGTETQSGDSGKKD
jgi:hypothetical protein